MDKSNESSRMSPIMQVDANDGYTSYTDEDENQEAIYDDEGSEENGEVQDQSEDVDSDFDLEASRAQLGHKLKSRFEAIFEKYGKDFSGIGDEIDLVTGEIVVNNGHLQEMTDERDAGDTENGRTMLRAFTVEPNEIAGSDDEEPDYSDDEEDLDREDINLFADDSVEVPAPLTPRRPGEMAHSIPFNTSDAMEALQKTMTKSSIIPSIEGLDGAANLPSEHEFLAQFGPELGRKVMEYVMQQKAANDSAIEPAWQTPGFPVSKSRRPPGLPSATIQRSEERSVSPDGTSVWAPQFPRGRRRRDGADMAAAFKGTKPRWAQATKSAGVIGRGKPSILAATYHSSTRKNPQRQMLNESESEQLDDQRSDAESTSSTNSGNRFTQEDDDYVLRQAAKIKHAGGEFWGVSKWEAVAFENPRHSWRSWEKRYRRKHLSRESEVTKMYKGLDYRVHQLELRSRLPKLPKADTANHSVLEGSNWLQTDTQHKIAPTAAFDRGHNSLWTEEDDEFLFDWIRRHPEIHKAPKMWTKVVWEDIEVENPVHNWRGWSGRYRVKYWSGRFDQPQVRVALANTDESSQRSPSPQLSQSASTFVPRSRSDGHLQASGDFKRSRNSQPSQDDDNDESQQFRIVRAETGKTKSLARRRRSRKSRSNFSAEDDEIMLQRVERWQREGKALFSQPCWRQLSEEYPQHNMWAWMNRFRFHYFDMKTKQIGRLLGQQDLDSENETAEAAVGPLRPGDRPSKKLSHLDKQRIPDKALDLFSQSLQSMQPSNRSLRQRLPPKRDPNKVSWAEAAETIEIADPVLYAGILADARRFTEPLNDTSFKAKNRSRKTYMPPAFTAEENLDTFSESEQAVDADDDSSGEDDNVCFCQSPGLGNMIGCDNPNCPYEWFHFNCVGITDIPNGSWYCQECSVESQPLLDSNKNGLNTIPIPERQSAARSAGNRMATNIIPNSQSSLATGFSSPATIRRPGFAHGGLHVEPAAKYIRNTIDVAYEFSDEEEYGFNVDDQAKSVHEVKAGFKPNNDIMEDVVDASTIHADDPGGPEHYEEEENLEEVDALLTGETNSPSRIYTSPNQFVMLTPESDEPFHVHYDDDKAPRPEETTPTADRGARGFATESNIASLAIDNTDGGACLSSPQSKEGLIKSSSEFVTVLKENGTAQCDQSTTEAHSLSVSTKQESAMTELIDYLTEMPECPPEPVVLEPVPNSQQLDQPEDAALNSSFQQNIESQPAKGVGDGMNKPFEEPVPAVAAMTQVSSLTKASSPIVLADLTRLLPQQETISPPPEEHFIPNISKMTTSPFNSTLTVADNAGLAAISSITNNSDQVFNTDTLRHESQPAHEAIPNERVAKDIEKRAEKVAVLETTDRAASSSPKRVVEDPQPLPTTTLNTPTARIPPPGVEHSRHDQYSPISHVEKTPIKSVQGPKGLPAHLIAAAAEDDDEELDELSLDSPNVSLLGVRSQSINLNPAIRAMRNTTPLHTPKRFSLHKANSRTGGSRASTPTSAENIPGRSSTIRQTTTIPEDSNMLQRSTPRRKLMTRAEQQTSVRRRNSQLSSTVFEAPRVVVRLSGTEENRVDVGSPNQSRTGPRIAAPPKHEPWSLADYRKRRISEQNGGDGQQAAATDGQLQADAGVTNGYDDSAKRRRLEI